jgi:hypothetical protein
MPLLNSIVSIKNGEKYFSSLVIKFIYGTTIEELICLSLSFKAKLFILKRKLFESYTYEKYCLALSQQFLIFSKLSYFSFG